MIRTSLADGRYFGTENDLILGTAKTWAKEQPKAVLYCHGSGTTLLGVVGSPNQQIMLRALARRYTVHAGDYGLESWGNDSKGIASLEAADALLTASWGAQGKLAIVCASMGTTNAMNFARVHPTRVSCIAAIIPCVDIKNIYDLGAQAVIDAAYPPTYNDLTVGQTHNPIHMAEQGLLPADLPIHLWTKTDDATCLPITANNFLAARPQTGRTSLGTGGHTTAAVAEATPAVLEFLREHH